MKVTAIMKKSKVPQYSIVAGTESHVVNSSGLPYVVYMSCNKKKKKEKNLKTEALLYSALSRRIIQERKELSIKKLTYNVVHRGLIATAEVGAVEANHHQATVQSLHKNNKKI